MKLNRLIIQNIEGRILAGVIFFVTIMLLIGWVAINEPSRMAAFENQATARSIELGAELFASNCSTCHNADGRGQAGRAPALNNPHMFGYNFLGDINDQIATLERQMMDLREDVDVLNAERDALFAEVAEADAERQAEIVAEIGAIDEQLNADGDNSPTVLIAAFEEELVPLYEERDTQLAALEEAILKDYYPTLEEARAEAEAENDPRILTNYFNEDADRLLQVGWAGNLEGYLTTTLVHGRPGSLDVWGEAMVAWSQEAGGPLRSDQINDIVNYILNWDKGDGWTVADATAVNQYGKLHAPYVPGGGGDSVASVGTDVAAIMSAMDDEAIVGDPVRGENLYNGAERAQGQPVVLACSSCHAGGVQAPDTIGTWSRVQNERLTLPEFSAYTVEQYLIESIARPNDYVVDTYSSGVMPQNYGEQLSVQDIADILAYIEAQG
ncbi:MAG: c-type cytochrome [Aggregatilineales bacterium]